MIPSPQSNGFCLSPPQGMPMESQEVRTQDVMAVIDKLLKRSPNIAQGCSNGELARGGDCAPDICRYGRRLELRRRDVRQAFQQFSAAIPTNQPPPGPAQVRRIFNARRQPASGVIAGHATALVDIGLRALPEQRLDPGAEVGAAKWFGQQGDSARQRRKLVAVRITGDDQGAQLRKQLIGLQHQVPAGHARHGVIGDQKREIPVGGKDRHGLVGAAGAKHLEAERVEKGAHRHQDI